MIFLPTKKKMLWTTWYINLFANSCANNLHIFAKCIFCPLPSVISLYGIYFQCNRSGWSIAGGILTCLRRGRARHCSESEHGACDCYTSGVCWNGNRPRRDRAAVTSSRGRFWRKCDILLQKNLFPPIVHHPKLHLPHCFLAQKGGTIREGGMVNP